MHQVASELSHLFWVVENYVKIQLFVLGSKIQADQRELVHVIGAVLDACMIKDQCLLIDNVIYIIETYPLRRASRAWVLIIHVQVAFYSIENRLVNQEGKFDNIFF